MRSLQSKLGSGLIVSLVIAFTVLWFIVSEAIQYLAEEYIASRLQHDAEVLLSQIKPDKPKQLSLADARVDSVYNQPFSGHYYQINIAGQTIKSRSLWDSLLHASLAVPGKPVRSHQDGPDMQQLLVMNYAFVKQGRQLQISIAEDLNPVKANIRQFQKRFAITAVIMLLVLVILQVMILRHNLKTLREIRDELKQLQEGKMAQLSQCPLSELQPLVMEINYMLSNMSQRLRRSRGALGDMAHAIKRPLTVIQQYVEHAETIPLDLRSSILEQLSGIKQLTERTLTRASLAGDQHGITRFSFTTDMDALLRSLELMYRANDIQIKPRIDANIDFHIDRQDMLELLGNLLENACKWASHRVLLTISQDDNLLITVEDDGPGAEGQDLKQLSQRGTRLDENKPGYGLGLGIVTDIVTEYGGSMRFSHSTEMGGLRADISLPKTVN